MRLIPVLETIKLYLQVSNGLSCLADQVKLCDTEMYLPVCHSERGWQGIIGRKPTPEEIASGIGTCDLYM